MPGVRITPNDDRKVPDNSIIVLSDISRPFKKPKHGEKLEDIKSVCGTCGVKHLVKTYHLQLRGGSVIVSETIWAKFQTMPDNGGFKYLNHVENPPAQGIGPGTEPVLIEKFSMTEVAPAIKQAKLAKLLGLKSKSAKAGEN